MGSGFFDESEKVVYRVLEQIKPDVMKDVIGKLGDPNNIEVSLLGNFDYSDDNKLYPQIEEIVPGLLLLPHEAGGENCFRCVNPSKSLAANVHEKFFNTIGYSPDGIPPRRIRLNRIWWYFDSTQLELNPWKLDVSFRGDLPKNAEEKIKRVYNKIPVDMFYLGKAEPKKGKSYEGRAPITV